MEGYGGTLNTNDNQMLTPKKDGSLQRKSNLRPVNNRNEDSESIPNRNNWDVRLPKKQQTLRQMSAKSDLIKNDMNQGSNSKRPLLWSGRKSQKDIIVKDRSSNGDSKPLKVGKMPINKVAPFNVSGNEQIYDCKTPSDMDNLELAIK